MSKFRDINFELTGQPSPVSEADLRSAESVLRCTFPTDYRDFLREFGPGEFSPVPLQVLPPSALLRSTTDDQQRLREHWFWSDSSEVWSQKLACESIACFDGCCGDDVRFHPSDPDSIYILPHDETCIYRVASFAELLSRFLTLYNTPPDSLRFEPI